MWWGRGRRLTKERIGEKYCLKGLIREQISKGEKHNLKQSSSWAWYHVPIISKLETQRHRDCLKLEVRMDYSVSSTGQSEVNNTLLRNHTSRSNFLINYTI